MNLITEFYVDVRGWKLCDIYKMACATDTYLDTDREILIAAEVYKQ